MIEVANEFDDYFLWLANKVDADLSRYSELLYILYDTDFVYSSDIELDQSRCEDGLSLREDFVYENPGEDWVFYINRGCNVFEAILALAIRMEDNLAEDNSGDRTRVWFWQFIKNLGLGKYTNDRLTYQGYGREEDDFCIQEILNKWMFREFDYDGTGSIFPLKKASRDQRNRPIIYQMSDYIFENFIENDRF